MFQENSIETCILSRVKHITSPGWMHETSAQTWCTGKTQRDRVEKEVGVGIGMGNTCKPMAVSFQCMTKSTTILKKKKKAYEKVFQEIIVENFPRMEKEITNQVQQAQRITYKKHPKRNMPRHILMKLTDKTQR